MKKLTQEQVNRKYRDVYVDVYRTLDYTSGDVRFEVRRSSKIIRENMTLGQDVGTELAYTR